jgi:hypothetical protein
MRAVAVLAGALLAAACATPASRPSPVFAVSLSRDVAEGWPVLVATVTNLTPQTQCVRTDPFRNIRSYELRPDLRDVRGRAIPTNSVGILPVPMPGVLRIEPGESLQGRTFLVPLFRLRNGGIPFPPGIKARVTFDYGPCGALPWRSFRSDWQPL